jgi:hypothetical protein
VADRSEVDDVGSRTDAGQAARGQVQRGKDQEQGGISSRRLDFFCLGDRYQTAHVVEAKRPGDLVGRKEFDQLRDYVLHLRKKLQEESTDPEHKRAVVRGLLVADRVRAGDEGHAKSNLLTATETMHKEFLDVVKGRAPADDPRMEGLSIESDPPPAKRRMLKAKAASRRGERKKRGGS